MATAPLPEDVRGPPQTMRAKKSGFSCRVPGSLPYGRRFECSSPSVLNTSLVPALKLGLPLSTRLCRLNHVHAWAGSLGITRPNAQRPLEPAAVGLSQACIP
jgi:hypothetical protein